MGTLRIMSRRGDDRVQWDTSRVLDGELDAVAAVREAERIFEQQRAKGATAFKVTKGEAAVRIDKFDPEAEQIMIVPRVVGG
ncbi:MAG TPA: hypothetical protein VFS83_14860 [Ktedonobacterales bacterium]|nr:hypothetical protein [Ktedonobacterales bacterium]